MKKYVAFALALMLICACALAETCAIPTTTLSLDIPGDFEIYELLPEDTEDDVVIHTGSADGSVDMYIYAFENDGWTIEELVEALTEEDITEQAGTTDINGITTAYRVFSDGESTYVEYETISDGNIVDIIFAAGGDTAAAKTIMETLSAS